jgi:hypothetical protein
MLQSHICHLKRWQAQCLFFAPQVRQSQYSHQIHRRCWISRKIIETIANRSSPGGIVTRIARFEAGCNEATGHERPG